MTRTKRILPEVPEGTPIMRDDAASVEALRQRLIAAMGGPVMEPEDVASLLQTIDQENR